MAELSEQQEATLKDMREHGLEQPAMKLEGLFAQIRERPDDAQLTELIANMLKQYLPPAPVDPPKRKPYTAPSLETGWPEGRVDPTPEGGETINTKVRQAMGLPPTVLPPMAVVPPAVEATPRLELVVFEFIIEMARVMQEGLADTYDPPRQPGDWKKYTAADLEKRRGSLLRHYGNGEWASVAVNAMILWWHERNKS